MASGEYAYGMPRMYLRQPIMRAVRVRPDHSFLDFGRNGRLNGRITGHPKSLTASQFLDCQFGWLQSLRKLLKGKKFWLRGPATIRIV